MRQRWFTTIALGASGVLIAHRIGYAFGSVVLHQGSSAVNHAYMSPLTDLVLPLTALAIIALLVRAYRSLNRTPEVPFLHLVLLQIIIFLIQETLERIPLGTATHVLFDPDVLCGLAAQIAVAYLLVRAVRTGEKVVEFVRSRRRRIPKISTWVKSFAPPVGAMGLRPWRALSKRGPPRASVAIQSTY